MVETAKKKTPSKKAKKAALPLAAETSSVKSVPAKKRTAKKIPARTKKITPHFVKDSIPTDNYSDSQTPGTGIFTTLLALLIIAWAVLAGYVYAQKIRMEQAPKTPAASVSEPAPRRVSVSSAVLLTPEVVSSLEAIVAQVTIPTDDVLEKVIRISDVTTAQTESPTFFSSVQSGDLVFEFKTIKVLFRPSSKEVIKVESISTPQ